MLSVIVGEPSCTFTCDNPSLAGASRKVKVAFQHHCGRHLVVSMLGTYTYMYVCMFVCIHVYVCMGALDYSRCAVCNCMDVCMNKLHMQCVSVCVCVRACVCAYVHTYICMK